MGQKVNPTGLRLGISQPCYSYWYASNAYYSFFLNEDQHIRKLISQVDSDSITTKVEIARRGNSLRLRIFGSQINSFGGSPYKSLKKLQAKLRQECLRVRLNYFCRSHFPIKKASRNILDNNQKGTIFTPAWNLKIQELEVQMFIHELRSPEQFSSYVASRIGKELEQRAPFRRVIRFREKQVRNLKNVRGVRIQIAGRLNGAEIARAEWTRSGQVPLHTICANIDYSCKTAHTIYGLLGIKVWIFRPVEDNLI
jgi:small subunit ribosomal protein S3